MPLPALFAALGRASSVMGAGGQAMGLFPPAGIKLTRESFDLIPNAIPSMGELVALARFGIMSPEEFIQLARENGFDANLADMFFKASQALLTPADYISLLRRNIINKQTLGVALRNLGFEEETMSLLESATEYLPGPQDLIRFAVREVYSPQIVSEYGLNDDFPEQFVKEASKVGMSEETAKQYWRSHWNLPSITQGFEMFHRRVITEEQLKVLLRTQDVIPFWQDKLIKISYNPLTRVDVRRMRKLGVLTKQEVEEAYLDDGYSPENARRLSEFVETDVASDLEGITTAAVLKAYINGLNTREETITYLKKLKLGEDAISLQLELADFEILHAHLNVIVADLQSRYNANLINEATIRQELKSANAPDIFIDQATAKILASKAARSKSPTKSDLERWFNKDLITEKAFFDGLISLGYNTTHAQLFLAEELKDKEHRERHFLSDAVYARWIKSGIMSDSDFRRTMEDKNVSRQDIGLLIDEAHKSGQK